MITPTAARAKGPGKLYRETRFGETSWWLDFTDSQGKRRRRKLSSDRKTAERMRSEIIARRDREASGLGIIGGQDRQLDELAEAYLSDLKVRGSAGYVSNKGTRLRGVLGTLRAERVRDLTPSDVIALQGALQRDGNGNTTINMKIGALVGMMNWATRMRLIDESPIRFIKPLPINEKTLRRRRRALTEDEIGKLLAACDAEDRECSLHGPRTVPQGIFFRTVLETGLRFGELRTLSWGAIDFETAMLEVRGELAKSGKSRCIPLRRELCSTLGELLRFQARLFGRDIKPEDRVFLTPRAHPWTKCSNNCNRLLYRLLDIAGIARFDDVGRKLDVHGLRVSFCTRLARTGAPLEHARLLMGHADVRLTSRVYTHLEAEQTRAAIENLPPTTASKPAAKLRLAE